MGCEELEWKLTLSLAALELSDEHFGSETAINFKHPKKTVLDAIY